ncbi:MAG TPA: outer membrane lipoprotein-sorting protein [Rectinema sp.]|nr:outer membrane lipoprotein-sorting protein [Spirochaetia bacterium]MDI9427712.1 outer membrane lipoprotein-sorting protein [Spirochaetota bacterium]HNT60216.1 outer membrane lipoprotein-sorting protein [Rectinema sp.]HNV36915.1 outer membrane lipoprotein-sorting protein [Rectinema sp.]HOO02606.1 outer membrane lipoprotein-sorting protein [Rectinema sp.]
MLRFYEKRTWFFSSKSIRNISLVLLGFVIVMCAQAQGGPPPGGPKGGGGPMAGIGLPLGFLEADKDYKFPDDITKYTANDFLMLVRRTDIRSSFYNSDMNATITTVNVSPTRGTFVTKEQIFRRDKDDAFLMLTLEPESRKGQGMLRVDNNMWRYDPTSRKFTHTTLKDTYENTTVTNNDFRRWQRSIDYSVEKLSVGTLGNYKVIIGELKANNDEVPFPYIKMYIEADRKIVLKVEEYSLSMKLLRTAYYTQYVQIGDSFVPTVQIFQDGLVPEKRSQVTYTNISTKSLPDYYFTKEYLERVSQ